MQNRYIAVEGLNKAGKSTLIQSLISYLYTIMDRSEVVLTYEPGGGEIANEIRSLVQAKSFLEEMDPICEAYLYAASRAQTLRTVVKPALEQGKFIISDRCVVSSIAFQGEGRGLGVMPVKGINKHAVQELLPEIIFFLDIPAEVSVERAQIAGTSDKDKFEKMDIEFANTVRDGYLVASELNAYRDRWVTIDATQSEEEVFEDVKHILIERSLISI